MGTETVKSATNLQKVSQIWRYSPRNGDGNSYWFSPSSVSLFGDIVPGMGTETCFLFVLNRLGHIFGDIVPGMGTETFLAFSSASSFDLEI